VALTPSGPLLRDASHSPAEGDPPTYFRKAVLPMGRCDTCAQQIFVPKSDLSQGQALLSLQEYSVGTRTPAIRATYIIAVAIR
jgi:hypothetical protein